MSLAIFLIGLALFVYSLHPALSAVVIVPASICGVMYVSSMVLSALWLDCPYRISLLYSPIKRLVGLARFLILSPFSWYIRHRGWPRGPFSVQGEELQTVRRSYSNLFAAISWLHDVSSNVTVQRVAAQAPAGLSTVFKNKPSCREMEFLSPNTLETAANVIVDMTQSEIHGSIWLRALETVRELCTRVDDWPGRFLPHFKPALFRAIANNHSDIISQFDKLGIIGSEAHYFGMGYSDSHGIWRRIHSPGTPLQAASMFGHVRIVEMLLDRGDGIDAKSLQNAAEYGRVPVLELFLSRGADLTPAIWNAVEGGHLEVLQFLHDSDVDMLRGSILSLASRKGHTDVIQFLLELGANVDDPGTSSRYSPPLHAAVQYANVETVQLLLDRGATVNLDAGDKGTALQAACLRWGGGNPDIIKLLLNHGANPNTLAGHYGTALQAASFKGNVEVVRVLLEHGANVNLTGGKYKSALKAAKHRKHFDVVALLRQHGARA